jgi:hypothetical protein
MGHKIKASPIEMMTAMQHAAPCIAVHLHFFLRRRRFLEPLLPPLCVARELFGRRDFMLGTLR